MQWSRTLVLVYVNIALYALCFQMQRPIEPFLTKKLNGDDASLAVEYGKVQSFFGIMQTVGSFFFGLILDRIGGKMGFLVVFLSAFVSYATLSTATTMQALYLSKVPQMFLHAFMVAQLVITQEAAPDDRARALGYLMGSYTVGATIGPAIGGFLGASGDHYFGAKIAAAGSLLSAALVLLYPNRGASPSAAEGKVHRVGALTGIRLVLTNSVVLSVLLTKLVSTTTSSMIQGLQPVIFMQKFGMQEGGMGAYMSTAMAFNALCGWFAVGALKDRFDRGPLVFGCLLWISCCYLLLAVVAPGSWLLEAVADVIPVHQAVPWMVVAVLASMASFIRGTVFTDISTSSVPDNLKGTLLGLEHGIFSLSHTITPRLGTSLYTSIGLVGMVAGGAVLEVANAFSWRFVAFPRIEGASKGAKIAEETQHEKKNH